MKKFTENWNRFTDVGELIYLIALVIFLYLIFLPCIDEYFDTLTARQGWSSYNVNEPYCGREISLPLNRGGDKEKTIKKLKTKPNKKQHGNLQN